MGCAYYSFGQKLLRRADAYPPGTSGSLGVYFEETNITRGKLKSEDCMSQWEARDPQSFKEGGGVSWNRYSRSWRQARSLKTGKRPTLLFPKYYSNCSAKTGGQGPQSKGDRVTNCVSACSVLQSYPALWDPTDCSPPGSSVHGILQEEHWNGLPCPPLHIFFTILYNLNIKKNFFFAMLYCFLPYSSPNQQCVYVLVTQSCPVFCNAMNCSLPGFYVHGSLRARILEWERRS